MPFDKVKVVRSQKRLGTNDLNSLLCHVLV